MKFIKGMILGGIISTGVTMMYSECMGTTKKKMLKKGKNLAKKIGMM